jgi:hypothetical protein
MHADGGYSYLRASVVYNNIEDFYRAVKCAKDSKPEIPESVPVIGVSPDIFRGTVLLNPFFRSSTKARCKESAGNQQVNVQL